MGKPLPSKELSVFRISSLFIFIELLVVPFCLANILKPNAVLDDYAAEIIQNVETATG